MPINRENPRPLTIDDAFTSVEELTPLAPGCGDIAPEGLEGKGTSGRGPVVG